MHGLRCSPAIPGFTRLLDEWVVGLTRYAGADDGVFEDPDRFAESFADAISRVRAFAYPAGEAPETTWSEQGAAFELQGYPYVAAREAFTAEDPDAFADAAEAAMQRAAAAAQAALASHESVTAAAGEDDEAPIAVGLVFVRIPRETAGDARAFRDMTRQLASTGAAWSFPSEVDGPDYNYTGADSLGGIVLARRFEA